MCNLVDPDFISKVGMRVFASCGATLFGAKVFRRAGDVVGF